jgi:hypothetical protein
MIYKRYSSEGNIYDWCIEFKYFFQAGLSDSRLRLCSEPEAASIYWQSVTTLFARADQPPVLKPYMVVDLGGIL